jgi:hypothetical protein
MTDDLTEALLGEYEEPRTPEEREAWRIEDDSAASWALRKLRVYEEEIDRLSMLAARERARVSNWELERTKSLYGHKAFFESKLIDYRRRLERKDPKLPQTYHVPGGAITRRKARARVEVTDAQVFLDWAKERDGDAVKLTPLVSALKDRKDRYRVDEETGSVVDLETGEQVPGVEVHRDPDQYGVVAADD